VVGCADVAPPHGAEASREGDVTTVRCNSTGETWFLSCVGSRWTGTIGNCSARQPSAASKSPCVMCIWIGMTLSFHSRVLCCLLIYRYDLHDAIVQPAVSDPA